MAAYAPSTSLLTPGRIGQAAWNAALAAHTEMAAGIVAVYHEEAPPLGLNPDLALAQAVVESGWFTSRLWLERYNPAGIGITGPKVLGKDYGSVRKGIVAHLHHLCCYAYSAAACPVDHTTTPDPRHNFHDNNPRLSHLQEPPPGRQWATGPGYVGKILAVANSLLLAAPDAPSATKGPSMGTPTIEQHLTPVNFWPGRNGVAVAAVVIHVSEGGRAGVESWFKNPASEASAHYLVNKDGTIWQFVREEDTAWANGRLNKPNLADPLIAGWQASGVNPNRATISVETERQWTERLTAPQLAALAWLCADIHRRHGLPTDGSRLLGHNEFDSVDRARCPSLSAAEWAALVKAVGTAQPAPPPPAPRPPGFLTAGTPDIFTWPDGEGVIVARSVRYYNPEKGKYYDREWHQGTGYGPWQEVP